MQCWPITESLFIVTPEAIKDPFPILTFLLIIESLEIILTHFKKFFFFYFIKNFFSLKIICKRFKIVDGRAATPCNDDKFSFWYISGFGL